MRDAASRSVVYQGIGRLINVCSVVNGFPAPARVRREVKGAPALSTREVCRLIEEVPGRPVEVRTVARLEDGAAFGFFDEEFMREFGEWMRYNARWGGNTETRAIEGNGRWAP